MRIDWIEEGISHTCRVRQMTRKQFGLCSRIEVSVRVLDLRSSGEVWHKQYHKRCD